MSQSTVSQQVRRLEEMLGKPLFERSSHQVLLTEEGVKLLSYARRIIALNEEAHDALTGIWRDGVLRIGMPEDFAVPTTELLADFSREHPHLRLDVASGLSADLHSAYAREELDLILVKQRRRQPPRRAGNRCYGWTAWPSRPSSNRRCRWRYFRSAACTATSCARRWTTSANAGASATAAPAWRR